MEAGGAAGGAECEEEERLQSAFKKLRVDANANSVVGVVSVCDRGTSGTSRVCLENNGGKAKLSCSKDSWHGCTRKSSRGSCRNHRRRRSKSPILQPPRFTYCGSAPALSAPGGQLKTADAVPAVEGGVAASSVTESPPSSSEAGGPVAPPFGSRLHKNKDSSDVSDFATLCDSSHTTGAPPGSSGVEVYSFTGLRHVVSECQRSREASRTLSAGVPVSGAARSCSEQARGFVDDVTIEDLSGYMEYYLYIPKKMSHMAEMMYT